MRTLFTTSAYAAAFMVASSTLASPTADHLVAGDVTNQGTSLVAGNTGATYELRGGAQLTFAQGSEYTFEPSIHLKIQKPGEPDTLARSVKLLHGRVDVVVPANLATPTAVLLRSAGKLGLVAKVGRSTFVAADDRSTAAAREGEMVVGIGNDWKPLHEGLARTLSAADPTALPHSILPAPSVAVPHPLAVSPGDEPVSLDANWSTLPGATSYELTVSRTDGKVWHQVTSETKTTLAALAPGSYSVSVAALDRGGLPSMASAPQIVRVVGIEKPDGAEIASDGTVVLGTDQSIALVGATGLEISYGESTEFATAHGSISLAHGMATTARLRVPGSAQEAVIHLEPKGLRAHVDIGPKLARWPLDRVAIDIELYDAMGRPIPDDARVDTSVTVNLTPVQVAWARSKHNLHAFIAPSTAPGPWVVRTEVKDQQGKIIGRNFLEIDRVTAVSSSAVAHR